MAQLQDHRQPDHLSRADSREIARRRRGRSLAIFFSLLSLSVLFFAIAIIKMSRH